LVAEEAVGATNADAPPVKTAHAERTARQVCFMVDDALLQVASILSTVLRVEDFLFACAVLADF